MRAKLFLQKIRKELVDARVIEGHIVPHRLLFTSHVPSPEYQTVAWLPDGIQVNVSMQPSSFQTSRDVKISAGHNSYRHSQEERDRDTDRPWGGRDDTGRY